MAAPIFSLPETGTDPRDTTKEVLESAVQGVVDTLHADIQTRTVDADLDDVAKGGNSDQLTEGTTNLLLTAAERSKLTGIEAGATGDQTGAEIKALYEANADTNAFTDAEKSKLTGIEAGAQVNRTAAALKTDYEGNADTNAFTDSAKVKVDFLSVTAATDLDAIRGRVDELDAAVILKGSWDASAGTFPGGGTAQAGHAWVVSVAGTVDGVDFNINDRLLAVTDNASTGTYAGNWVKLDYTDSVLSVAGKTGAVTLVKGDVGLDQVDNTSDADKPVSTAQRAAIDALLPPAPGLGDYVAIVEDEDGGPIISADNAGRTVLRINADNPQDEIRAAAFENTTAYSLGDDYPLWTDADNVPFGVLRAGELIAPQPGRPDGITHDTIWMNVETALGDDVPLIDGNDQNPIVSLRNGRLRAEIDAVEPAIPEIGLDAWGWRWCAGLWAFTGNLWGDTARGYLTDGTDIVGDSVRANVVVCVGTDMREAGSGDVPYHAFDSEMGQIDGQAAAFCEAEALHRIAARQSPPVNFVATKYDVDRLSNMLSASYMTDLADRVDEARGAGLKWRYSPTVSTILLGHGFDAENDTSDYAIAWDQLIASLKANFGANRVVFSQFAGTKADGSHTDILGQEMAAQGVLATPLYPFAVDATDGVNLTDTSARLVAEIEALASLTTGWKVPRLIIATLETDMIRVKFDAPDGLAFDDYVTMTDHGFEVDGVTNGAAITGVTLDGDDVLIAFDSAPTGTLTLRYAYNMAASADDYPANRGGLRADWGEASKLETGTTLRKYAAAFETGVL